MRILGVTGGTGSGKSLVCQILKKQGAEIIDADEITRELQKKGSDVYNEMVRFFGDDIVKADGELIGRRLQSWFSKIRNSP